MVMQEKPQGVSVCVLRLSSRPYKRMLSSDGIDTHQYRWGVEPTLNPGQYFIHLTQLFPGFIKCFFQRQRCQPLGRGREIICILSSTHITHHWCLVVFLFWRIRGIWLRIREIRKINYCHGSGIGSVCSRSA